MAWSSYSVSRDAKRSLSGVPCDGVYERGCHYRPSCWQLLSETQCASPNGTLGARLQSPISNHSIFTSQNCLETTASGWHTFPSIHIHFSNHLSQDQCRLLAHVSKHPISHLKLLSRSRRLLPHIYNRSLFLSQTCLSTTAGFFRHTSKSINFHIDAVGSLKSLMFVPAVHHGLFEFRQYDIESTRRETECAR